MADEKLAEPWLRGTLTDVPAVLRAVLHALESAEEDAERLCEGLTVEELNARPLGISSVAFHIGHITGSIDRLLSYAEGHSLRADQLAALQSEADAISSRDDLLSEFRVGMAKSRDRIRRFDAARLEHFTTVGKKRLPSTVAGLLIHVADHTQRHIGQALTTSKVVAALRDQPLD